MQGAVEKKEEGVVRSEDLNQAQADRLVMPVIEVQDADRDQDGRVDEVSSRWKHVDLARILQITMNIVLRMTNTSFRVRSVYWMLFYSVQLKQRAVIDVSVFFLLFNHFRR